MNFFGVFCAFYIPMGFLIGFAAAAIGADPIRPSVRIARIARGPLPAHTLGPAAVSPMTTCADATP